MPGKPMGLLSAAFDYSAANEEEFNDWYDTEHIPERLRVPGFMRAERWLGAEDPKLALATYDLESLDVLRSVPYRAVSGEHFSPWSRRMTGQCRRIYRFEAEQMPPGNRPAPAGAGGLLVFAMNVAPEAESEFNAWYDEEHVPRLSAVPGVLCARRYTIRSAVSAGSQRYLALYHLASPEVCSSKAWEEAAVTPWTLKMRPLTRDRLRIVLRRYERKA
jgi:hypothetical protein